VSDRWVVLKGLLDSGDEDAMTAAMAEARFLAAVEHPNIVKIYNFVEEAAAGYTVMEYVGGESLKTVLADRRAGEGAGPLPVDQAIAYVLEILPAFGYLHRMGLVFCDFKPDNVILQGDSLKLIDLGGVRRLDDPSGSVYGTVGYQAPEIAEMGPSIPSDIYTIGRTLAVLALNFKGFSSTYKYGLPDPAEHPALANFDSFHRFLLKATARHPDDRFQSVGEMSDQLVGVLREVVALTTGKAEPAPSTVFNPPPDDATLPTLALDATDAAASFLANLTAEDPVEVMKELDQALETRQVPLTVEMRLRRARAYIELGSEPQARAELDKIESDDPWEWRAAWLRGWMSIASGDLKSAAVSFERCRAEVPGELAPKLAAAVVAERAEDAQSAAILYEVVSAVDPAYVAAATGLARCRAAAGDIPGALAAFGRIPETHRAYARAQLEAVRTLFGAGQYDEAATLLARLEVDDHLRAEIGVQMVSQAFDAARRHPTPGAQLNGRPLTERTARTAMDKALRQLAELTPDDDHRYALVDQANKVRPLTLL
jgi:serine/threonine-protein kinase PknG